METKATPAPSRDVAFVVHLISSSGETAGQAHGRVEHVTTGLAARFESTEELLRFMRQTIAALAARAD